MIKSRERKDCSERVTTSDANVGRQKAGDQIFLDTFSNSLTVELMKPGQDQAHERITEPLLCPRRMLY